MQAYSEKSTFCNLWRTDKPKEMQLRESSLEQNVSKEAVPLFIMHTPNDEITRCGVEKWQNPAIAKWVEYAAAWANEL